MTTKTRDQVDPEKESSLLSYKERAILSQIAAKEPPFSQRAQALLAIDEDATQSAAGQLSGLSAGQVGYWLGKFRKGRTSIFPQELLDQVQQEDAGARQDAGKPTSPPDTPELELLAGAEGAQPKMPTVKESAEPVEDAAAQQADSPQAGKKRKKKSKKATPEKKPKKETKKAKKAKKPRKKTNKKKLQKAKGSKGKSGKKNKKKRRK